jgi:hypothetical protein
VRDDKATATIGRLGPVVLASDDVLDNTYLSLGAENPLTLQRAYKGGRLTLYTLCAVDFICNFELSWYPFDTQRCFMNISLEGNSDIFVNLSMMSPVFTPFMSLCSAGKDCVRRAHRPGSVLHQG